LGTPDYFDRAGIPMTPAELFEHQAVIYTRDSGGSDTWTFRKSGLETSVRLPDRLRVSASEAVRTAVLRGMGLAIASQWMFEPELASGAVRAVLTEWTLPEDGPLGGVPGWPDGECKDTRFRDVHGDRTRQAPFRTGTMNMPSDRLPSWRG
jgi:DNA-binding transcriptional LysR family regulator